MRLYSVTDGDEVDRTFASKAEAIRFAKETDRFAREQVVETSKRWGSEAPVDPGWRCTVTKIETIPLSRALVLAILNEEGYALEQTRVWPPGNDEEA